MKKKMLIAFKDIINSKVDEYKTIKRIKDDYKVNRIAKIIREYDNTRLYSFMLECLQKVDFKNKKYTFEGITIEDNDKILIINIYPNIRNVERIIIDYKENGDRKTKCVYITEEEIEEKDFIKKDIHEMKSTRKYELDRLVYEDISFIKRVDNDNYDWINDISYIDENDNVLLKEFTQIRKEGFIERQYFNYYSGYLENEIEYFTRSKTSCIRNLIESTKEKISYDDFERLIKKESNKRKLKR